MAKTARITFKDFCARFATEDDCRNYLFQERFPAGFVCPKCGNREYYYLKTRRSCQCKNCRRQTSVTAGTVMHRTHLPLTIWLWVIYLCATDKRGISAKGLSRQLEVSYESAWYLLERIRSAMHDRDQDYLLDGIIEMDEAYLGAPKRGKKRGRGTERKKMTVTVSKDEKEHPLFLRFQMIPDVTTATLQNVINDNVKPDSTIECDTRVIQGWRTSKSTPQSIRLVTSNGSMSQSETLKHSCSEPTAEAVATISPIWMNSASDSTGGSSPRSSSPDYQGLLLHLALLN